MAAVPCGDPPLPGGPDQELPMEAGLEPEYLLPDVSDADILAEWDRKIAQPDHVPYLRGRRLADMQGPLLDTILQHLDDFTPCRSPHCAFIGRTDFWVQNSAMNGQVACPRCGEQYRRDRSHRAGHNIARYNKVLVFHSDTDGRPIPRPAQGCRTDGRAMVYPIWWDEYAYCLASSSFRDILHEVQFKVSRIPADRLLSVMRVEVMRYQFACLKAEHFSLTDNTRIHFQYLNENVRGPPWARNARWEWEQAYQGFVGFDGSSQMGQTDILDPEDLVRLWAFSEYFSFAERATRLAAARAGRSG